LPRSPLAPEEVRVRRREIIEEEFTAGEQVIGDLEQLHQVCGGELRDARFGARNVTASQPCGGELMRARNGRMPPEPTTSTRWLTTGAE
jgi:hypothetical protein